MAIVIRDRVRDQRLPIGDREFLFATANVTRHDPITNAISYKCLLHV